jgi:hypothetical protein
VEEPVPRPIAANLADQKLGGGAPGGRASYIGARIESSSVSREVMGYDRIPAVRWSRAILIDAQC